MATIREILSIDKLLVCFQNEERMRSGRFTQPTVADISIEWLMQAYMTTLQREGKNIHLVPIAINYDRLFEIRNLATEIVSDDPGDMSFINLGRLISSQFGQTVGKVYVTCGEVISLKDYLTKNAFTPLSKSNMDTAALKLTSDLTLQQEWASPVVLNMMVAALLLQASTATLNFNTLFFSIRQIYNYIIRRGGVKMIMVVPPSRIQLLDTIKKLGFEATEVVSKQRGPKNYTINLDAKRDQKVEIGLSYYSNNLLQNFMMDSVVCKLLVRNMIIGDQQQLAEEELVGSVRILAKLLRNEYLLRDSRGFPETVIHRVETLASQKELIYDKSATPPVIRLNQNKIIRQPHSIQGNVLSGQSFSMITFFSELGSHIIDTYLIVLMVLDGIIQGNMVIKESNLIESIHFAIIEMYNESLIPSLQSCLRITIKTALHSFAEKGMIVLQTYFNTNGSRVSYYSAQTDGQNNNQLKMIQERFELLSHMQAY